MCKDMKVITYTVKENDEDSLTKIVNEVLNRVQATGHIVVDIKYNVSVVPQYFVGTDFKWQFKPIYSALIIYGKEIKNISEKPLDK